MFTDNHYELIYLASAEVTTIEGEELQRTGQNDPSTLESIQICARFHYSMGYWLFCFGDKYGGRYTAMGLVGMPVFVPENHYSPNYYASVSLTIIVGREV